MARLRPTFADYVVIAISPALIMALVGSLVFFLLEVFYQGQLVGRMTFIMAMFVMAAVLIGRISIQEGREYAALFAVPLAIVTLIAMFRFVEFHGALARFSPVINVGLVALIWWSADRLTWDCTVIDESQDASGEGLLQTVGLEQDPAVQESSAGRAVEEMDGTTDRAAPQPTKSLWQKFIASRHSSHPHGVWVVYFSLAALPLFGVGQWFIRADDLESRRYVFKLLVVYVAAALGLLLTTSFLGLRRYLRQRRLEMPTEMAGVWMGTGAIMIVALLLVCLLLPRRNAEYSITHLPAFAGSPDGLWTSDHGVGSDGPEEEDAQRQVTCEDGDKTTSGKDGQESGGDQDSSKAKGGDQKGQKSGGSQKADGRKSGGSQKADGQKSRNGEKSSGQSGKQKSSQQDSSEKSSRESSSAQEKNQQQGGSEKSENGERPDGSKRSSKQEEGNREQTKDESGKSGRSSEEKNEADENEADKTEADEQRKKNEQSGRQQKQPSSESRQSPERKFDPAKLFSKLGAGVGALLKLIYWLIVFVVVLFLVWRFHAQIRNALQKFLRSLRDFWERLFGGGRAAAATDEAAADGPAEPPPPLFSAYSDPFLSGAADSWSTDQLVKYSFDALEAWARERGCQRFPEQTPYEFAQAISHREATLERNALRLAELYNMSAYAQRSAPQSSLSHIRRLWEVMSEEVAGG